MWPVRMLCADQHPSHRSITRFRTPPQALSELSVQTHRLCKRPRLVGPGTLAVNGTNLRTNASQHRHPHHSAARTCSIHAIAAIAVGKPAVEIASSAV
jgi:hypothetical protein